MTEKKATFQLVWGMALFLAGIGVIFMMPEKMAEIEKIELFSSIMYVVKFCFYLMAILLIGGGARKIFLYFMEQKKDEKS